LGPPGCVKALLRESTHSCIFTRWGCAESSLQSLFLVWLSPCWLPIRLAVGRRVGSPAARARRSFAMMARSALASDRAPPQLVPSVSWEALDTRWSRVPQAMFLPLRRVLHWAKGRALLHHRQRREELFEEVMESPNRRYSQKCGVRKPRREAPASTRCRLRRRLRRGRASVDRCSLTTTFSGR
jgi:hypothetical protein